MKIVKLKGGLGNQMFQYAYARLLDTLCDECVKLDYSAYKVDCEDAVRVPRIAEFKIVLDSCTDKELKKINYFNHIGMYNSPKYKASIALENLVNRKYFLSSRKYIEPSKVMKYSYFDGYWQDINYIRPIEMLLREEFKPRNPISEASKKMINIVSGQNSVFVGVRRGDYANEQKHYGVFESAYYKRAMKYISERVKNPIFYIFSNDVKWCKDNLDWGDYKISYREPEQQVSDFEELLIMSSCRNAIIINSTFHWWGAFLITNKDKIICCPDKWFFDKAKINIYPKDWVQIGS